MGNVFKTAEAVLTIAWGLREESFRFKDICADTAALYRFLSATVTGYAEQRDTKTAHLAQKPAHPWQGNWGMFDIKCKNVWVRKLVMHVSEQKAPCNAMPSMTDFLVALCCVFRMRIIVFA